MTRFTSREWALGKLRELRPGLVFTLDGGEYVACAGDREIARDRSWQVLAAMLDNHDWDIELLRASFPGLRFERTDEGIRASDSWGAGVAVAGSAQGLISLLAGRTRAAMMATWPVAAEHRRGLHGN